MVSEPETKNMVILRSFEKNVIYVLNFFVQNSRF